MTYVEVYRLTDDGDSVAGTITFDGRQFILNPPESKLLQSIMKAAVMVDFVALTAQSNPLEWLNALQFHYRSAYLRVSAPMQATPVPG